ncbi:MAG: ATP-binding protein [Elusimicrobiota bacterium]
MAKEKVLVIEDDVNVSDFCFDALTGEGYEVEVVSSGENGLALLQDKPYNLALVDLHLPGGMDGIQILKEIRIKFPHTAVIIFSGVGKIEIAVESMRLGAYDYITKPFSVDELRFVVDRCLEQQRLHTEVGGLRNIKNLYKVSIMMSSLMEVEKVLDMILKLAGDMVHADSGSLMMVNEKTGELTIGVSMGMSRYIAKNVHLHSGDRIAGWVAKTGEALLLTDRPDTLPQFKDIETNPKIKSSIVIPLKSKDKIIGVLNINNTGSTYTFTQQDFELLKELAVDAAVAIENAKVYERLKEIDTLKTQFISMVSHELRTPLTIILSSVENLDDGIFGELNLEQHRWIKEIGTSANRLNTLISDILDLSKLESGQTVLKKESIKLSDLIQKNVAQLSQLAKKRGLTLKFTPCPKCITILADPKKIEQVLVNLIDNALKFTPAGGSVEVTMKPGEKDEIIVTVADTGIGIKSEYLEVIFNRFQQLKQSDTPEGNPQGVGLGLAIAKEIVTQHGGRIWAESEPGKGSRFIFALPIEEQRND